MHVMKSRMIDLTHPLEPQTPVFPDYPPVEISLLDSTERQATDGSRPLNSSRLAVGLHCGTHMDAPFHFFGQKATIDQVSPLDCMGPCVRIRLPHCEAYTEIGPEDLIAYRDALKETGKVILDTGWHRHWGRPDYFTDHPALTGAAAEFLVECGVRLVGVDFPSVDRPPYPAHVVLLGNDVLIVENLANLDGLRGELCLLVALPLKIVGRDGSPVRVLATEIEE